MNLLTSTPPHRCPPSPSQCPPVCLASGSDTQYPHCVAVLQQEGEKQHISAISVMPSSFLSTHKEPAPQNGPAQQQVAPLPHAYLLFVVLDNGVLSLMFNFS